jgi:hypothetical protein
MKQRTRIYYSDEQKSLMCVNHRAVFASKQREL